MSWWIWMLVCIAITVLKAFSDAINFGSHGRALLTLWHIVDIGIPLVPLVALAIVTRSWWWLLIIPVQWLLFDRLYAWFRVSEVWRLDARYRIRWLEKLWDIDEV